MTTQPDLFGNEYPEFATAKDRYGVWPVTVWPIDHQDPATKRLKARIGDGGEAREEASGTYGYQVGASVFSPSIAQFLLNAYTNTPGNVYDPFGGGGTRAIMSAWSGHKYLGVEIRKQETEAVRKRIERAGVADSALVVTGDSRHRHTAPGWADYLLTCPPYYDLEKYEGGEGDLSMAETYADFLAGLGQVIDTAGEVVRPGGVACWVVGLHRDASGGLLPLPADIARLHTERGWTHKEEIVLNHTNNGAVQRVGMFERGKKLLIRTHEYAEVFVR